MQFPFGLDDVWNEEVLANGLTKVTFRRPIRAVTPLGVYSGFLEAVNFHVPACPIFGDADHRIHWM